MNIDCTANKIGLLYAGFNQDQGLLSNYVWTELVIPKSVAIMKLKPISQILHSILIS